MNWSYMKQRPRSLMAQLGSLGHQVFFENLAPLDKEFKEIEPNVFLFTDTKTFLHKSRLPFAKNIRLSSGRPGLSSVRAFPHSSNPTSPSTTAVMNFRIGQNMNPK